MGGVTPPDTFEDESRFGNDGVHTDITWTKLPSGLWVRGWNATSSLITIADAPSITNIFATGGTVLVWINPSSDGEGTYGRIADKTASGTVGWTFYVRQESGERVRISFNCFFSTTLGSWRTTAGALPATPAPLNTFTLVGVTYNASDVANVPTFYGNGLVYALGTIETPEGTYLSDVGVFKNYRQ